VVEVAIAKQEMNSENFAQNWQTYYEILMKAIKNIDARTVGIDGDSDTWETQRLAEFKGQYTQIPSILYTKVNAARRALIARLYDSGKIIVATNKIKREYGIIRDGEGNAILKDGREQREHTGNLIRQGFEDQNYAWGIQLRHLYKPAGTNKKTGKTYPQDWGIKVLKCKANPGLIGEELWGDSCNFASLVELAYPNVAPEEWGL
jgi:hypothetical protein